MRATAVNRLGARLVGIATATSGEIAFTLAGLIGALSGILIVPLTTIYYDTGFLIGLKGFVAAIIGGMASYPIAALGASSVGLLESFSSFWASALKEVIVFTTIIPVLLWRRLRSAGRGGRRNDRPPRSGRCPRCCCVRRCRWLPALPPFWITLANYIGIASIVAIGLVVLTGVAGMTSFGQASFIGFGAYTTAILTTQYGISPWLDAARRPAVTRARRPGDRRDHAAAVRPLSGARHHRLAAQPLLHLRQSRPARPATTASPAFRRCRVVRHQADRRPASISP